MFFHWKALAKKKHCSFWLHQMTRASQSELENSVFTKNVNCGLILWGLLLRFWTYLIKQWELKNWVFYYFKIKKCYLHIHAFWRLFFKMSFFIIIVNSIQVGSISLQDKFYIEGMEFNPTCIEFSTIALTTLILNHYPI